MPDQELDRLYQQLRTKQSSNAALAEYLKSMDALYDEIKALYRPDAQGLPPLLDAERLAVLRAAYDEAAQAAEAYLKGQDEAQPSGEKREERRIAQRISGLMSRDMTALLHYENDLKRQGESALASLPTIIEKARSFTIDMSSVKVNTMGGAMSQRIPMEVTINGVKRRGMFTKKNTLDCGADYRAMIDEAVRHCPDDAAKGALNDLLQTFRDYYPKIPPALKDRIPPLTGDDRDALPFATFINGLEAAKKGSGKTLLMGLMGKPLGLSAKDPAELNKRFGKSNIEAITDKLSNIGGRHYTHHSSGIAQNSRLDDRNAAMSKVASLLSVPEIICSAMPMRCKDENGNLVEGTFMEMADGVDCSRPKGLNYAPDEGSAFGGSDVVRDLANLQMLDYICGNTDRHQGNMIFSFEGPNSPYVTGVKGIDNDLSFGASTHENGKSHLAPLKEMRVVSESMAQRIEALSPAQLKFALREFSLSEAELDAAGRRLECVQKMLTLSREKYRDKAPVVYHSKVFIHDVVRIVPDQDFRKMAVAEICSTCNKFFMDKAQKVGKAVQNIFDKAITNIRRICTNMSFNRTRTAQLAEVTSANRATHESAKAQRKAADDFSERMRSLVGDIPEEPKKPDGETMRPDEETKTLDKETMDLNRAVKRYRRYQTELSERLKLDPNDPNTCFDAVIGANDLFRMKQLLGELNESASAYLDRENVPNDALKKLAEEIQGYSDRLRSVPPEIEAEEQQTVMANDRQAMERFNRSMAKRFTAPAAGAPSAM